VGAIAGGVKGSLGQVAMIGAAAGATAGMLGVLLSRGQDVVLGRGTAVEMVLDRNLEFEAAELDFGGMGNSRRVPLDGEPGPATRSTGVGGIPTRRHGLGIP
jgi:hypothetical protein